MLLDQWVAGGLCRFIRSGNKTEPLMGLRAGQKYSLLVVDKLVSHKQDCQGIKGY